MADPFDLQRFVAAQAPVMAAVDAELRAGRKRTHWMWFVFPQLRGLGSSGTALHYGIGSPEEAKAFLAHPVLGPRLIACVRIVNGHAGKSAHEIFGSPDDVKFRSCLTLFEAVGGEEAFGTGLDQFFDGARDERTLRLLSDQE